MLSNQAIEEYKEIYQTYYREELSCEDAKQQANNLIRLCKTVLPLVKDGISLDQELNLINSA
jgi:hypothetical protein